MSDKAKQQNLGMVDVSNKEVTRRVAKAMARIYFSEEAIKEFVENGSPKGNVLEMARVAGIMAAKSTPQIIPLCHPIELNKVRMTFDVKQDEQYIQVESEVVCTAKTGAEIEALTACSAAALTIYDMMKWKDKSMKISDVQLLAKSGGKTGDYQRTVNE